MAIFTINDMAHRIFDKGRDNSNLGCWCWSTLRGKENQALTVSTAYRPNPPQATVMGVYAQHAKYFNAIRRGICPRQAFLQDLHEEILRIKELGQKIILLLEARPIISDLKIPSTQ
jgi:hypothetical protein